MAAARRPAKSSSEPRRGLRIRTNGASPELCAAILKFARWARTEVAFPVRVHVYVNKSETIRTIDGAEGVASFYGPFSRSDEPFIRLATGDYNALKRKRGRDNALAGILTSLCHEIVHYRQWVRTGEFHERGVNLQAVRLLHRYSRTTDHP